MDTNNRKFYSIDFQCINDKRGKMCVAEFEKEIPFLIKRVFYQFGFSTDCTRGQHANLESSFVFVCLSGECTVIVDDGKYREKFVLKDATKGLFLSNNTWKEMSNFSSDCVLLVLSDKEYNKTEYITDYGRFLELVNGKSA